MLAQDIPQIAAILASDEQVQAVFEVRTGPSPYSILIRWAPHAVLPRRLVAVTNKHIIVFDARDQNAISTATTFKRLPRNIRLASENMSRWSRLTLGQETFWIHRRNKEALKAADVFLTNGVNGKTRDASLNHLDQRGGASSNILLTLGMPLLLLGAADVATGLNDQSRLLGAALAGGGTLMVGASIGLLREDSRQRWGRAAGFAGGIVGASAGIYLGLAQVGYDGVVPLWVWIGVIAASLAAIWRLPKSADLSQEESGGKGGKLGPALTSLGVSATFIFGLVQFWYANQYIPSAVGASLAITGEMTDRGLLRADPTMHAFDIAVTIKNPTKTKVQVVRSLYAISGLRVQTLSSDDMDMLARTVQAPIDLGLPALDDRSVARHAELRTSDVLQFGKVIGDGWFFDPAMEHRIRLEMIVPESTLASYGALHLYVQLLVAKGDRLTLDQVFAYGPSQHSYHDGDWTIDYIVAERGIPQLSWVRRLTRGKQSIATVLLLRAEKGGIDVLDQFPQLVACVDVAERVDDDLVRYPGDICPPANELQARFARFYGVVYNATTFQLPLSQP